MIRFSSFASLSVTALALLSLTACGDDTPRDIYADTYQPPEAIRMAPVAPPATSYEPKQVLDPRTQVWRPGHWIYDEHGFVWVPGEVLNRPSATAVWSPDRWEHRLYGWCYINGYWQ